MRDLDEVAAYIANDSEQAAYAVAERIDKEAKLLSRFPRSGSLPGASAFSGSITALENGPPVSDLPGAPGPDSWTRDTQRPLFQSTDRRK